MTHVYAAVFTEKGLLMVKRSRKWNLPGHERHEGEWDSACLRRFVSTELECGGIRNMHFYRTFEHGPMFKQEIDANVYLAEIEFPFNGIAPTSLLRDYKWVGRDEVSEHKFSYMGNMIVQTLLFERFW